MSNMSDQQFQTIYDLAHRAGLNASGSTKPHVDWIPGSAWVIIDGTSPFSLWTKKKNLSSKGTVRGRTISASRLIPDHLDHKEAYVKAFANTLNSYGIKATPSSRLD